MNKVKFRKIISAHIKKHGIIYRVNGALGEIEGCDAYVEETRKDPMWETKYYGISYWYKGITENNIIDSVTLTKRAFAEILRISAPFLPFILLFQRDKLLKALQGLYRTEGGLKGKLLNFWEFCPFCQEIMRVAEPLILSMTLFSWRNDEDGWYTHRDNAKPRELVNALVMFLQFSPSWRVRGQDAFGELDKDNLKKSFLKEIWRIRNISMDREIAEKKKTSFLWYLIILACIFKRKPMYDFFIMLDIEKVKLDESDWYYCLRRCSYNFGGKSLEVRLVEARKVDKKKKHLILGI